MALNFSVEGEGDNLLIFSTFCCRITAEGAMYWLRCLEANHTVTHTAIHGCQEPAEMVIFGGS